MNMQKFVRFLGHRARVASAASLSFLRWLLCPLLALACETREPEDRPLAQVGTELITERDYRSFVAGLPEWTKSAAEGSDQVRDYLQSLVDRALILRAARAQQLEQSTAIQKNMEVALRLKVGQAMEQRYNPARRLGQRSGATARIRRAAVGTAAQDRPHFRADAG